MKQFTLVFEPTETGRRRYEMSYQAIALAPRDKPIPTEKWDDCVGLVRAIKNAGVEAPESVGGVTLYDLREEGATVSLDKGELKMLIGFVSNPIWRPLALEDAQELKKWLEQTLRGEMKLVKPETEVREAQG